VKNYDIIWMGTGQATGTVVPRLAEAGKTVALIEGGWVGGTCVNYGCTPTKTLVASARAAHMARRGADFGVNISDFKLKVRSTALLKLSAHEGFGVKAGVGRFERWAPAVLWT
jgi:pyruvate/2-oxoglutarate dehydrogenase complex dihydrolipoamide dehydrogenase (E3) component